MDLAQIRKFLVTIAGVIAAAVAAATTDNSTITDAEWVGIASQVVTAIGVYRVANLAGGSTLDKYTKAIVAASLAGLTSFASLMIDGITYADYWQIAVAVGSALGVYAIPNVPELTGELVEGAHFRDDHIAEGVNI